MKPLLALTFLTIILSACTSAPKTSYYFLSADPNTSSLAKSNDLRVMVGPVTLPTLIDQPQLVVLDGKNQVNVFEFHRWAGSLKNDIGRVIAVNLSRDLDTTEVWNYSQSTQTQFNYQVFIDVQSLDSKRDEGVTVDVLWTIKPTLTKAGEMASSKSKNKVPIMSGRSLVTEPVSSSGLDALVAAQSRAFSKVSKDIAKAIR